MKLILLMLFQNNRLLSFLFLLLGSFSLCAQVNHISTFVYHRFGDDRFPSTNIKLDQFEAHLKYLKENDYQVLSLSEALNRVNRRKQFPKTAVLTIDDGYLSFYENALPLLKEYNFPATLFVNTETIGGNDFMSWNQIKEAQEAGIEIGNHSHTHAYFLNLSLEEFELDLAKSEKEFTQQLGKKPKVYAYPYGEWNGDMAELLESNDYVGAVAQNSGAIYRDAPQFHLPRFPMSETYAELEDFVAKLKTRPLHVIEYSPIGKGYMGSNSQPWVNIEFNESNLNLEALQCFIQGAECQKSIEVIRDGLVKLSVKPNQELKSRRTLFTITVPDKEGNWHWFSYSWVINSIK